MVFKQEEKHLYMDRCIILFMNRLRIMCLGATVLFLMLLMPLSTVQSLAVKRPTDVPPSWGPILSASCNASFEYYAWVNTSFMVPVFSYRIVGIGNHNIDYTMEYNFSLRDGSWLNESYRLRDDLFFIYNPLNFIVLLMNGYKPFKMVAQNRFTFPQGELVAGRWAISMDIDNKKFIHDTYVFNQ